MRPRSNEHGGVKALVFWLALLGLFIYAGTKFAPPYVASNQFIDEMDVQAKEAAAGNIDDVKVRRALLIRAKDLALPVKDSNIRISRTGGEVVIQIEYTVIIELPFQNFYKWKFTPRVAKPILT
jgi:hypothetical protein